MAGLQASRITRSAQGIALFLAIVAVAIFLVTSSLRLVINSDWLYSYGFDKYEIPGSTGIARSDLMRVAREIRAYFNNGEKFLDVQAVINGVERPLYNQREVLHMRDVKGLVQGVYLWQWASLGYLAAFTLGGLILQRRGWVVPVLRSLLVGSSVTIGGLLLLGLLMLANFSQVFLQFHLLSFSNDLWMLDPRTDYLIRMFPQGFFQDAALFVAGISLGQAVLLALTSAGILYWRRRGSAPLRPRSQTSWSRGT